MLRRFLATSIFRSQKGAGTAEYAIMLALVAVIAIGSVAVAGGKIRDVFFDACEKISGQDCGATSENPGDPVDPEDPDNPIAITVTIYDEEATYQYLESGQEAPFAWTITGADDVQLSAALAGVCMAQEDGEDALPVYPNTPSGSDVAGSYGGYLDGCTLTITFDATAGEHTATHAIAFEFAADSGDPEEDMYGSVTVWIDGEVDQFKAIGPGGDAVVAWEVAPEADAGVTTREVRNINGTCPAEAGSNPPSANTLTGAETIAWSEDLVGCSYEITFQLQDEWGGIPVSKTATLAFLADEPVANPVRMVTVNGGESATIAYGEAANFEWVNEDPLNRDIQIYDFGSCTFSGFSGTLPAGNYSLPWSTQVDGCEISVCVFGENPDASGAAEYEMCATANFAAQDSTPNPMSFETSLDVPAESPLSSSAAIITGINVPVTLTLPAGVSAEINGGAAVSGSVQVVNNDSVVLSTTSPSAAVGTKTVTITKSSGTSFSASWLILSEGADKTPVMPAFQSLSDQKPSGNVSSNVVVPSAYAAMPISVDNGSAIIASSSPRTSGIMTNGQNIRLDTKTPSGLGATKTVTLHYGPDLSLSTTWTVTTKVTATDLVPTPIGFSTDPEASSSAELVSLPEIASGYDAPVNLSFNGQICVNGSCSQGSASVAPGDTVVLRVAPPESCGNLGVAFGSVTGSWYACPHHDEPADAAGWCAPRTFDVGDHLPAQTVGWAPTGTELRRTVIAPDYYEDGILWYEVKNVRFRCSGSGWYADGRGYCTGGANGTSGDLNKENCISERRAHLWD